MSWNGGGVVDVRKPPVSAVLRQHPQGVRGTCGWCGEPCLDKTPARGWLKWIHDACDFERTIIEQPDAARRAVLARDKGICIDCGEDWSQRSKFVPVRSVETKEPRVIYACATPRACPPWTPADYSLSTWGQPRDDHHPFIELTTVSLWHVDHKVPLWKVVHMPDLQRLEYFKLANLITRCERCHAHKTRKEAADRAKFNSQAKGGEANPEHVTVSGRHKARPAAEKKPWASRPNNGWPAKGSRPMRRKK